MRLRGAAINLVWLIGQLVSVCPLPGVFDGGDPAPEGGVREL